MSGVRIQKYLSQCGVGSRRDSERLIAEGRVVINGVPARFGDSVEPGADEVLVDGKAVAPGRIENHLFYKPRGVLSVASDQEGRTTVGDYIGGLRTRLFPLAPLPQEAEGALLLTNNGDLAQEFNDPGNQAAKTYIATVERPMHSEGTARLRRGLRLDTGPPVRARVVVLDRGLRTSLVRITLVENRGHGVNELLAAAGHPPIELRRIAIANLSLDELEPGQLRPLSERDIAVLRLHMRGRAA